MNPLRQVERRWRAWRHLRQARAAIRRADRAIARRRRLAGPGYYELLHPAFVVFLALAVLVLLFT